MTEQVFLKELKKSTQSRIVLVVIDGLGGLRHPDFGNKSELEHSDLPNLDALTRRDDTVLGVIYPVERGIVPGSAAGHLGLFGYDPFLEKHRIGRGVLEALDLGISLDPGDVVARLNFATTRDGVVTDRRAGRIADARELAAELNKRVAIKGAKVEVIATREYRGVFVMRHTGPAFGPHVTDTDPKENGYPINQSRPKSGSDPSSARTAEAINSFTRQADEILQAHPKANSVLLRGFSTSPALPTLAELHGLETLAIADYPLYRGIAKLLGMSMCEPVQSLEAKVQQLKTHWDSHTFFFIHYKEPDIRGEDGDFLGKVKALEAFDKVVPLILETMNPATDVLAITGDHSTPSLLRSHSHHSVPLLIFSAQNKGYDESRAFNEKECAHGTFGRIRGIELMSNLLSRAGKLQKYDL